MSDSFFICFIPSPAILLKGDGTSISEVDVHSGPEYIVVSVEVGLVSEWRSAQVLGLVALEMAVERVEVGQIEVYFLA